MALQEVDHNITDIEEPLLARLLLTLEEMVKRYQKLLPVLQQEKRLMIEGNLNDLIPCLSEKEGLLGELRQLEERRIREVNPLAKRFRVGAGFKPAPLGDSPPSKGSHPSPVSQGQDTIPLRQLIDLVPIRYREPLLSCYNRLKALSSSVVEINQINGLLIGRILQQVNSLLGLLTHLSSVPSTYQAGGVLSHDFQNGRFFRSTGSFHTRG